MTQLVQPCLLEQDTALTGRSGLPVTEMHGPAMKDQISEAEEYINLGGFNSLRIDLGLARTRLSLMIDNKAAAKRYFQEAEAERRGTEGCYRSFESAEWSPPDSFSAFEPGALVAYARRDSAFHQFREMMEQ